jgi:hypothetical protein
MCILLIVTWLSILNLNLLYLTSLGFTSLHLLLKCACNEFKSSTITLFSFQLASNSG